jgi:PAS domain S-box-containing protein
MRHARASLSGLREPWTRVPEEDRLSAALGAISAPQHVCSVCENSDERDAIAMRFVRVGVERGEKCLYVAEREQPAMRAALQAPGLEVTTWGETYLQGGVFAPERMWAYWPQAAREARAQGFSGLRCIAEVDWVARSASGAARWMEYESRLGEVAARSGCTLLCQYSHALFPPWVVRDVIRTHPLVIHRGTLCGNIYYEPPEEFLGPDRRSREVERLLEHLRQRTLVEEKLRQADARNVVILESITDAFTSFDRDWRFVYVNERAVQFLGKPREALIGRVVWELFPDGMSPEDRQVFLRAMAERVPVIHDVFAPLSGKWYSNHVYPTSDGLAFYWRDVTEARQAQQEMRRSEAYLAEGQRISRTGSWAWNVASGEVYWSQEHYRICGLDPRTFTPTIETALRIIHPEDSPAAREIWEKAWRGKRDYEGEFRVLHPDGTVRHVRSLGHPVLNPAGELTEYVGTIMDITEQKQSEDRLAELQVELLRVARATTLGELAASIAHEVNQPLAAIATSAAAGETWLAATPPNIGETAASLQRIDRDATRAGEVIARIRAMLARRPSEKAELPMQEVLRDVCLLVQREAEAKRIQMQVLPVADRLPAVVGDRVLLQQVVLNLVMNAFEAMSEIETARRLELGAERYGINEVLVSIADTGVGIEPEVASRMFDAFFTTKADGMGMGLAISRSIVDAHGGRLWVSGNDGPGATLRFTLPSSQRDRTSSDLRHTQV